SDRTLKAIRPAIAVSFSPGFRDRIPLRSHDVRVEFGVSKQQNGLPLSCLRAYDSIMIIAIILADRVLPPIQGISPYLLPLEGETVIERVAATVLRGAFGGTVVA